MAKFRIPAAVRERAVFGWRSFMNGIDEAGRIWNHNRVVGIVLVLAIVGIGFFPIQTALEYRVPTAILAVSLITLNGAYIEFRKQRLTASRVVTQEIPETSALSSLRTRDSAVRSLSKYQGTKCDIVWAKNRGEYLTGNPGAEQMAEYLNELLTEAGWVASSYMEDITQTKRPGVAEEALTIGWWRYDQETAFVALLGILKLHLPQLEIGINFEHAKDKTPRIIVWSKGL